MYLGARHTPENFYQVLDSEQLIEPVGPLSLFRNTRKFVKTLRQRNFKKFAKVHNSQEKIKKITANSHLLTDQKKLDNYYWVTKIFGQEFFAKYINQTAVIYKLQVYKKACSSGDQELFFWKRNKTIYYYLGLIQ